MLSLDQWLPFSISEGGYTTDWEIGSFSVKVSDLKSSTTNVSTVAGGNTPNAFANASSINTSISNGGPYIRLPYPGEAGQRNAYRGDGNFGVDGSLSKPFHITEKQTLRFTWEVYNVTNAVRFNTRNLTTNPTRTSFGNYSATLTTPRRQEFALRYAF